MMSPEAVVLDVPLVRQDELFECGLVSLSALCQYYHVTLPPDRRAALATTALESEGLSGAELRSALDELGLESYIFAGTLDRTPTGLYTQLDAGRPPIVLVSRDGENHHYCLVLGYDEPKDNVFLLDPLEGPILVPLAKFTREWDRSRRFTLLAIPRPESADSK